MVARSLCVLAACIALTAASSSDIQVSESGYDKITVTPGAALIQSKRYRHLGDGIVEAGIEERLNEALTTAGIDHAHLICHSTDCVEVKALMAAQQKKATAVQAALADCASKRKALSDDLAEAAKKRGVAEVALAKCATERQKLQDDLAQCGKDRAKAEADLAQCASDRAKLEAELKQCAEVDRPNAEKALAACGKERGELEAKLAELVKKLASKASLMQISAQESSEHAELLAQESDLRSQLAAKIKQAGDYGDAVDAIDKKVEDLTKQEDAIDAKVEALSGQIEAADAKGGAALDKLAQLQTQAENDVAAADKAGQAVVAAIGAMHEGAQALGKAQGDLASELGAQVDNTVNLLQLNIAAQEERRSELAETLNQHTKSKEQLKSTIDGKTASGAACEADRAALVTLQGKIDATTAALNDCLNTKKVLQAKIDATTAARLAAESALADCLATKERLKKGLADCLARKAETKKKLTECLDRKKVLKTKIDECHKKRDEARAKLATCLKKKEELKAKIKAAQAKLDAKLLLQTDHAAELAQAGSDLAGALKALKASNSAFNDFVDESEAASQALFDASQDMEAHTAEENGILNQMASEDADTTVAEQLAKLGKELAAVASAVGQEAALESGAQQAAADSAQKAR